MNTYRSVLIALLGTLVTAGPAMAAGSARSTATLSTSTGCGDFQAYEMTNGLVADPPVEIPLLEARDEALTGFAIGPDGQQFAYLLRPNKKVIDSWWTEYGAQPVALALLSGTKGESVYLYNSETQLGVSDDAELVVDGKLTQATFCYVAPDAADVTASFSLPAVTGSPLLAATSLEPGLLGDLKIAATYATGSCVCRITSTGSRVCFPTGCFRR